MTQRAPKDIPKASIVVLVYPADLTLKQAKRVFGVHRAFESPGRMSGLNSSKRQVEKLVPFFWNFAEPYDWHHA